MRDFSTRPAPVRVSVDVILDRLVGKSLLIREDESRPARLIPRYGVQLSNMRGAYVTLSMTERQAVNLNLI